MTEKLLGAIENDVAIGGKFLEEGQASGKRIANKSDVERQVPRPDSRNEMATVNRLSCSPCLVPITYSTILPTTCARGSSRVPGRTEFSTKQRTIQ